MTEQQPQTPKKSVWDPAWKWGLALAAIALFGHLFTDGYIGLDATIGAIPNFLFWTLVVAGITKLTRKS